MKRKLLISSLFLVIIGVSSSLAPLSAYAQVSALVCSNTDAGGSCWWSDVQSAIDYITGLYNVAQSEYTCGDWSDSDTCYYANDVTAASSDNFGNLNYVACSNGGGWISTDYFYACTSAPNDCGQTQGGTIDGNDPNLSCSSGPPGDPAGYGSACSSGANACGQTGGGSIQCDGSCNASVPANPGGYGSACTSSANSCGATNAGSIQCNGSCSASAPANPAGYGSACNSAANACGQRNAGSIQCNGTCSAGVPANPAGYGSACTSSANSCGATNSGTVQCNGSCSASTPANPSNLGQSCTSAANICGQTNTGTYQCNGSCSASAPSNATCAPTCTLSSSPSTINLGQTSTLTWTCSNATSCSAVGGFSTGGATNNATGVSVTPSTTSNYQLSCTGVGGSAFSNVQTVQVLQPTAYITAAPPRLAPGGSTSVSWSATNVNSCSVTGTDGYSSGTLNGPTIATTTVVRTLTSPATFTISCPTQSVSTFVKVNVAPSFTNF